MSVEDRWRALGAGDCPGIISPERGGGRYVDGQAGGRPDKVALATRQMFRAGAGFANDPVGAYAGIWTRQTGRFQL